MLGAYLVQPKDGEGGERRPYGHAPFATKPLRDLRPTRVKAWYDGLPYGRTSEKLLMVVRAILAHARSRGWIESSPAAAVERQQVRYSGRLRLLHPRGDRRARRAPPQATRTPRSI